MENTINKLESGRAAFAYQCAEEGRDHKEYKSYVKKLPMLIKTNGLGAALSFYFANGSNGGKIDTSKAYGLIYRQIENWLRKDEKKLINFQQDKLAEEIIKTDSTQYKAVTIEVMAFLSWLRRFADALSKKD